MPFVNSAGISPQNPKKKSNILQKLSINNIENEKKQKMK